MADPIEKIAAYSNVQAKLQAKKELALQQAFASNDPVTLMKAQAALEQIKGKQNIDPKAYFVDPYEFQSSFGYKDRRTNLSYGMLKGMARTPIINAIIRTRITQVTAFAEPQKDEFSVGYKIRKKKQPGVPDSDKPTKQESAEIDQLVKFIENCGRADVWGTDDFDTFIRKILRDSLVWDQMGFEVVPDKSGVPVAFYAVDGHTLRVAEDYDAPRYNEMEHEKKPPKVRGYYPSHVQIFNDKVISEFYPWEMCFGVRNPSSSIYNFGYGVSELEELVSVVTALLWGEEYNRGFFKQGSAPKGIIKVAGNFGEARLAEFRQQWNATMRGVSNAWKTPVLEADKVDWIDLQQSNKDMEFSNWIEFLIKVTCAIFTIDPAEVNFPLQGGANENPMFEGNNEKRLKHSQDKGLYPLLKFLQKRINKWIIERISDKYEFVFVGMDAMSPTETADYEEKLLRTRKTFNEIRRLHGDEDVEDGDMIGNSILAQQKQAAQQAEQMAEGNDQFGAGGEGGEEGDQAPADEEDAQLEELLDGVTKASESGNPFVGALNMYLKELNS